MLVLATKDGIQEHSIEIGFFIYYLSEASLSGRVRDGGAKQLLAKQLQGVDGSMPAFMDLTTGAIRSKKPKKEKAAGDHEDSKNNRDS